MHRRSRSGILLNSPMQITGNLELVQQCPHNWRISVGGFIRMEGLWRLKILEVNLKASLVLVKEDGPIR